MRAIADKADRLIAMHVLQGQDTCATVSADEEPEQDLVAVPGARRSYPPPSVLSSSRGVLASVAEPEPLEPYHFDPRRTGTVSLL